MGDSCLPLMPGLRLEVEKLRARFCWITNVLLVWEISETDWLVGRTSTENRDDVDGNLVFLKKNPVNACILRIFSTASAFDRPMILNISLLNQTEIKEFLSWRTKTLLKNTSQRQSVFFALLELSCHKKSNAESMESAPKLTEF